VLSRADIKLHSHAQFEDDALGNIQPVKVMAEDVTKTAVEFQCTNDDAGGSVQAQSCVFHSRFSVARRRLLRQLRLSRQARC